MCGIAGFILNDKDRIDTARLTRALHMGIDPRGGDATGAAWADKHGAVHHFTVVGRARDFRSTHPNAAAGARTAILHTRFATQGDKRNHLNNHPVRSGHFLLVHNGHIYNDDELFRTLPVPRQGEVDSEAAVALVRYANMKNEPVYTALERLEGGAALAWIDDRDTNTLHLARGSSSPLVVAMTENGSVVFASTQDALLDAMFDVGMEPWWLWAVEEGNYLRFTRSEGLVESHSFTPDPGYWWGKRYNTSGKGKSSDPTDAALEQWSERWRYYDSVWGADADSYVECSECLDYVLRVDGHGMCDKCRSIYNTYIAAEQGTILGPRTVVRGELTAYPDNVYTAAFSSKPSLHDCPEGIDPDTWEWGNDDDRDTLAIALASIDKIAAEVME